MNTILLADPPIGPRDDSAAGYFPNLGLLYIISYLRQAVPGTEVFYSDSRHGLNDLLDAIDRSNPTILGMSFASLNAGLCYEAINVIRQKNPRMLIVCGGCHPTVDPSDVLESCPADVCCIGEGERTFAEIVERQLAGDDIESVAGIAYRSADGSIRVNSPGPAIENLDDLPFPAWDIVDVTEFREIRRSKGALRSYVVASRGCPYRCNFCSNPVWKARRPVLRQRSPQNIAREVRMLYERGVREVYFLADQMNADVRWAEAVFEELRRLDREDLYFQCNLRVSPITEELVHRMKDANCWEVHIGIESANDRVLRGVKKGVTLHEIDEACRMLKRHGIKVFGFVMMYQIWEENGELKVETTAEVFRSLLYALKLRLKRMLDNISCGFAVPLPGSPMYEIADRRGIIREAARNRKRIWVHEIPMRLPGVTRGEMILARGFGLLIQGICTLTSAEYYRHGNWKHNLKRAGAKLLYMIRPW